MVVASQDTDDRPQSMGLSPTPHIHSARKVGSFRMAAPRKIGSSSQPTHGIGTALIIDRREQGHVDKGGVVSKKSMKPGGGGRFEAFVQKLAAQGKSPESARAIAASAGRRKYGAGQMAKWSAAGRKRA